MLRINRLTDYSFVLLAHLVENEALENHNARDLSVELDIPLPTVSKVLKMLTQGELLESYQGSQGGYRLARGADKISAAEIIEVMEGPVSLTACCVEDGCDRNCSVSKSWQKVNGLVVGQLRKTSLIDLVAGV
jgi:FeS assembly SUF system regulator